MRFTHPDMPRMFRVPFGSWFVPTLGSLLCILLMISISKATAFRFLVWTGIGQIIYFAYGFRHSKGRPRSPDPSADSIYSLSSSMAAVTVNENTEQKSQGDWIHGIRDFHEEEIIVQYF